jgi:hypothetical protein
MTNVHAATQHCLDKVARGRVRPFPLRGQPSTIPRIGPWNGLNVSCNSGGYAKAKMADGCCGRRKPRRLKSLSVAATMTKLFHRLTVSYIRLAASTASQVEHA